MRRWRLWVGIALSLVCLALALIGIEWNRVAVALQRADWRYLVPAIGALILFLITRSIRWRILLGPEVSLADAFAVTNIGYLISNVFPFRLGDPARAVAIGLRGKVKVSTALSTVVVERVLDMLTVVVLLGVTVPFVGQAGWTREAGIVGGAAAAVGLATLTVLARRPDWGQRLLRWALGHVPRIDRERWSRALSGFLDGVAALGSARTAVKLVLWSAVIWTSSALYYWAVLRAFVERPLWVEASFLTCAVGLSVALPSSPGAIGVFQTVARYALQLPFGMPAETAIAVAFGSHALLYITMCLLGLIGLAHQNLSWKRLRHGMTTAMLEE